MSDKLNFRAQYLDDRDPFTADEIPCPIKPIFHTFHKKVNINLQIGILHQLLNAPMKLEDCTIQLYRPDRSGPYLDVESTLHDQWSEIEKFYDGSKCLLLLRTQPRVRAQSIINKLRRDAENDDRNLSRQLIWLKHMFTSDQDIIHEFMQNDGLRCLIDIGNAYNQYRPQILRAMNKMILYVDGMTGFIEHTEAIHWLYSILETPEQVVLTMTLKLLIVFVEYSETNASIFIDVAHLIDRHDGKTPFFRLTEILRVQRNPEIMHLCMALINRTIAAIPDQDTFYDVTDWLESQGMQKIIERLFSDYTRYNVNDNCIKQLINQLNVYETVLKIEDGCDIGEHSKLRELIRRKDRLKSATPRTSLRRQAMTGSLIDLSIHSDMSDVENMSTRSHRLSTSSANQHFDRWTSDVEQVERKNSITPTNPVPVAPRRSNQFKNLHSRWEVSSTAQIPNKPPARPTTATTTKSYISNEAAKISSEIAKDIAKSALLQNNNRTAAANVDKISNKAQSSNITLEKLTKPIPRASEVFTAKQHNEVRKVDVSIGDRSTGLVNRAKDSLTAPKPATNSIPVEDKLPQVKNHSVVAGSAVSQGGFDRHWDKAKDLSRFKSHRTIALCEYTFSDDDDSYQDTGGTLTHNTVAPPPPLPPFPIPGNTDLPPLPPMVAPPPPTFAPPPPLLPPVSTSGLSGSSPKRHNVGHSKQNSFAAGGNVNESSRKTIRLHWREVSAAQNLPWLAKSMLASKQDFKTIWQEVPSVQVDNNHIQDVFEVKQGALLYKKSSEAKKELTVLDTKRSNAINIGLKFLPAAEIIKTSILTMDTTNIKRDGIEKLISMIPTNDEKIKIEEAKEKNKDIPLGRAEEFLMLLSSIDNLEGRLKVWLFGSDFHSVISELLEPLHDLKLAMKEIQQSKTFKQLLSTLLSIGNVLNESNAKSFHIEYLAKVTEVRDVNKNSLLYHVATYVAQNFSNQSDLHSEIPSIARCGRVDYEDLEAKLKKLESDCEECKDYLTLFEKSPSNPKKYVMCPRGLETFLLNCREDLSTLQLIYQITTKRFRKFCVWLGLNLSQIASINIHSVCKTIADFALEYKTTRGEICQQEDKKRHREERIGLRGKTIVEAFNRRPKLTASPTSGTFRSSGQDKKRICNGIDENVNLSQDELTKHLLNPMLNSISGHRSRIKASNSLPISRSPGTDTDIATDGGDEMIDAIVKTAVEPDRNPRARKSTKLGDRKSFRRKGYQPTFDEDRLRLPPSEISRNTKAVT
ncbi:hypothetical protein GJ496_009717 [Pomphorhynchus laevis]|nr:hypothetical protein GJ496_009717 [Pomphorhynchus laevis]